MNALLLYHSKLTLIHPVDNIVVVVELKVWKVENSPSYPKGIKYSLFCIDRTSGLIVIGFDNHKTKGPHKHVNESEVPYFFNNYDQLLQDFWIEVRNKGYEV
jgi:hypothetical protein